MAETTRTTGRSASAPPGAKRPARQRSSPTETDLDPDVGNAAPTPPSATPHRREPRATTDRSHSDRDPTPTTPPHARTPTPPARRRPHPHSTSHTRSEQPARAVPDATKVARNRERIVTSRSPAALGRPPVKEHSAQRPAEPGRHGRLPSRHHCTRCAPRELVQHNKRPDPRSDPTSCAVASDYTAASCASATATRASMSS